MDSLDRELRRLLPRLKQLTDMGQPQPEPARPRTSANYIRHIENLVTELEEKINEEQSANR